VAAGRDSESDGSSLESSDADGRSVDIGVPIVAGVGSSGLRRLNKTRTRLKKELPPSMERARRTSFCLGYPHSYDFKSTFALTSILLTSILLTSLPRIKRDHAGRNVRRPKDALFARSVSIMGSNKGLERFQSV
jgi:hypothetical protein